MSQERGDLYRYRTGYLRFKAALCDRNTGLLSYELVMDEVRRHFESQERLGILVMEIEDQHRLEGIYGWQACDRLLQRTAAALRQSVEQTHGREALLALDGVHHGRFVVFLTGAGRLSSALEAAQAAEQLRAGLAATFSGEEFARMSPPLRFRSGSSMLSANAFIRFERQVRQALDLALPAQTPAAEGPGEAEREIRRLLRDGDIHMLYQPVMDLQDGHVHGYEALVRGPAGTLLEAPASLFFHGDRLGLASDLDRICREQALEAAVDLAADSLVFINTRPWDLGTDPADDGGLSDLLQRTGRMPETVVLEISERQLQETDGATRRALGELRRLGVQLAIDHAGSGYATLQLIQDLRPDFVKIEQTLVRGIDASLLQQEVARSIIGVARRVECEVVAPGVETAAEAEAAWSCGVRLAQGFHLSPPRSAKDIAADSRPVSRGAPGP